MIRSLDVFIHNCRRAKSKKHIIVISLCITVLTILLAIYFTSKFEIKGNVALITNGEASIDSEFYQITAFKEKPPMSSLVMNKFDAIVIDHGDGKFDIQSIKGEEFDKKLTLALIDPSLLLFEEEETRGRGTNIVGFLVMFVFLQGLMYMSYFSEDKQTGMFKRVIGTPTSVISYLFAHCSFNFLMTFLPTVLGLVIAKEILLVDIGFGYLQYAFIVGLLSLLATAFTLFMNVISDNHDNMMALSSSIIFITTILAGCFYSFGNNEMTIDYFTKWLPQKYLMTLVQGMENGKSLYQMNRELLYLLFFSLILLCIGTYECTRRLKKGRYA